MIVQARRKETKMEARYEVLWAADVIVDHVVSPPQRGGWIVWDHKLAYMTDIFHPSREGIAREEVAQRNARR
jgi:hypothetical protein